MRGKVVGYFIALAVLLSAPELLRGKGNQSELKPEFHTSARCLACHNGLITPSGMDVSIGFDWRASIMANSSHDPYWQASTRRETIDHSVAQGKVEDECSICHMPVPRYLAKLRGEKGQIFSHLPLTQQEPEHDYAADGVTCSVCHQISSKNFDTRESYDGGFIVDPPKSKMDHPEYGPFVVDAGRTHVMDTSTGGFKPTQSDHIRDSALCGTCHTLFTTALGPDGREIGEFPEQMPYLEWKHSDYYNKINCQTCHMTEVQGTAPIAAVLSQERSGMHQHVFVGGNFFMQRMLNLYRTDLAVAATPPELTRGAEKTATLLQTQTARVTVRNVNVDGGKVNAEVFVENLTGHKLPTAFPSRRAWLHFVVVDRNGKVVFDSGKLNADGSIVGNDNDQNPSRYEPFYREITSGDQVEIYEPILGDAANHVTTGLLSTVKYLKDSRLLPAGFDKQTADKNIAVVGEAANDPNFTAGGDLVHYSVPIGNAEGPFHVRAELWYQPIGFRWAHNLSRYNTSETKRFVNYYESMSKETAIMLANAEVTR